VTLLALLVIAALAVTGLVLAGVLGKGADAAAGEPPTPEASSSASTSPAPSRPAPSTAPSASPAPSPSATSASPSPSPSASPSASDDASDDGCDPARVVVSAETDRQSYGPGEDPVLSLVVRNEGPEACTVNVGTSQMEFVLTSADERMFSSTDCQHDSQDLERTIEPGGEERATFEWSRNRTVPGCTPVEDPGPGTYALTTRLGARSSSPVAFTLQ
jgi:pyruvate/2-oxoglutarate dehydrogenase complex dihydrolipoamide acyltransferase (E2) component